MPAEVNSMSDEQAISFLENLRKQGSPFIIIYEESASLSKDGTYVSELGAMIERDRHFDYVGVLALLAELGADAEGIPADELLKRALEEISAK